MRPRSALMPHQVAAVERAVAGRRLAMLLEPGYGKTAAALTAMADLRAWPALVVAPAGVVATRMWSREAESWEHLAGLSVEHLVGTPARRAAALRGDSHVEVVSYENLRWLTDELGAPFHERYAAVVYDELSKMKHVGTARFRRMRARAAEVPVRLGLTGTPVGNHLLDLWGEVFLVAGPEALGPTFTAYRDRYFAPVDWYRRVWRLRCCPDCAAGPDCRATPAWRGCRCHREATAEIGRRVRPWAYALPTGPRLVRVPPVVVNPRPVALPAEHARVEGELTRQLWATLPSGAELEALAASALAGKLRQLAGGAVYFKGDATDATDGPGWEEVHSAKLDALDELLDELQGEPLLIFHWFRHEAVRIKRRLAHLRWADFATDPRGAVDAWNAGRLDVLLVHPQSAGHGVNLQAGGHVAVWFSLPWSHELWTQGNGRLARVGQPAARVTAHALLAGQADLRVFAALRAKGAVEAEVVDALR